MIHNFNISRTSPMFFCIVLALLLTLIHQNAMASSSKGGLSAVNEAAMKLVQFCVEPKVGLDEQAVAHAEVCFKFKTE